MRVRVLGPIAIDKLCQSVARACARKVRVGPVRLIGGAHVRVGKAREGQVRLIYGAGSFGLGKPCASIWYGCVYVCMYARLRACLYVGIYVCVYVCVDALYAFVCLYAF